MTKLTVRDAIALSIQFRFPLPPPLNHRLQRGTTWQGQRNMHLTPEARKWARDAALIVGDWRPVEGPLVARITLFIPREKLWRTDADGYIKPLIDATIGPRRDQRVVELYVTKKEGGGWAEVWVAPWIPMEERG